MLLGVLGVALFGNRAALRADLRALLRFDDTDRAFLRSLRQPRATREPVRWGKFNTGQKAAAWLLLVLITGVFVTGLGATALGLGQLHKAVLPLTYLVLIGHVAMAVVNPATRPALRGILTGAVNRRWATHHHAAWVEEVDAGTEGR
jgi:cytochrome b subunit of formate dehydrogenase